ncbi:hypothetical protein Bca4012_017902 [Brassica carinata]
MSSPPYDNGSISFGNNFVVVLVYVPIIIGAVALLYWAIRFFDMYGTQSPVPDVSTGEIELGHQELHLVPVRRNNFPFAHGETECRICLEDFASDAILVNTPCRHAFHLHCLRKWIGNTCPICRRSLV